MRTITRNLVIVVVAVVWTVGLLWAGSLLADDGRQLDRDRRDLTTTEHHVEVTP